MSPPSARDRLSRRNRLADEHLEALALYHGMHGHISMPGGYVTAGGMMLGQWLGRQARRYRQGDLDGLTAATIKGLDPAWPGPAPQRDPAPRNSEPKEWPHPRWAQMLAAARAFHAEHGHLTVPKAYVSGDGAGLGWWLSDRRNQHRKGTLNPKLAAELKAIDASWHALQRGHGKK